MVEGLVSCRSRNRMRRFMVGLAMEITARSLAVLKQVARVVYFCTIRVRCLKRTVNKTHRCVWLIIKWPTKKSDQNYVTYRRHQMSQIMSVRPSACYSFWAVKLRLRLHVVTVTGFLTRTQRVIQINLNEFNAKAKRFKIPIYQRNEFDPVTA